jgi:hypothetical protein
MTATESLSVHQAIAAVMGDVTHVGKDGTNQQQGFKFRGIDHTVNALGPAFRTHGLIVLPKLLSKEYREYQTTKGTTMRECIVEVEFTFVGPDGSTLTAVTPGEASDAGDKATSKAMSVAERTALLIAFLLPTNEPDPDETSVERASPQAPDPAIVAQRALLVEVKTAHPDESEDEQKERARNVWHEFGADPKRLNEMTERVKGDTDAQ